MLHRSWLQLGPMAPAGIALAAFRFKGPSGVAAPVLLAVVLLVIALIVYSIRRRRRRPLASPPGDRERAWAAGEAGDRPWQ